VVCRPPGPVDTGALESAVRAFVRRHPALQYQFTASGGRVGLRWVGHRVDEIRCEVTPRPPAEEPFLRAEIDRPFDVLAWPLLRCGVLQADRPVFHLAIDHLVADGWSTFLAQAEIEALYAQQLSGRPAQLRPPGDYLRYSLAQRRRYADGPALDAQVAAFQRLLDGRPVEPCFPWPGTTGPGTTGTATAGRYRRIRLLDPPSAQVFARICLAAKTTLFMGIVAAYGIAVHETTGHRETGVLVAMHNREGRVQDAIGWYANMLPVYFPTAGVDRFGQVVHQVRANLTAVLEHHELPLARLLDRLPGGGYPDGAGGCFITLVDGRSGLAWERVEYAPAYRSGYGMWAYRNGDGLSMVTASPQVHGDVLDRLESALARVLRTVVDRSRAG
jgi:hypothetical protein